MVTRKSNYPLESINANLSSIKLTEDSENKLSNWVFNPKYFLFFSGNAGCGKTYFCMALINYMKEKKISTHFLHERDYLAGLRECINNKLSYEYDLNVYSEIPLLIFDDLGSWKSKDKQGDQVQDEWKKEVLFHLVDLRYSNGLPTVFTSNYHENDLKKLFHDRFISRLFSSRNTIISLYDEIDMRRE